MSMESKNTAREVPSASEMHDFALRFAKTLKGGEVVALVGDLGAGKTTFVQGLAKAFGVKERVTSPTFVYMHVHKTKEDGLLFVHVDAYRGDANTLREIGLAEYLADPHAIVVIEWADKVEELLPDDAIRLEFAHVEGGVRSVRIHR